MSFPRNVPVLLAFSMLVAVFLFFLSYKTSAQQTVQAALVSIIDNPDDSSLLSTGPEKPDIIEALIEPGKHGRHRMQSMVPKYITIHSTQNSDRGATAEAHARLLARGGLRSKSNSLGYLTWHFSIDEVSIYQSLPTTEKGEHADYNGPGNASSIGIEMCENRGNCREKTLDQTARLTAWLMHQHNIPIENVVPHQHWVRIRPADQKNFGNKNCPHFLLDGGKPGKKWKAFLDQVQSHL